MKIINIVPGFGGSFYCGNCLRDSAFMKSFKKSGHEAITLPIYLPLQLNGDVDDSNMPVFYGAVNVYLKQQFSWLRNMPMWMERFFNSPFILRYAAKKAGSTRAAGLEEMSISMLKGSEGYQSSELEELIHYLKEHEKPDVVHLSNALLLGLAKRIKEELKIPVVCSLQDEDVWVDAMTGNYKQIMWDLLSEKAEDVDALIAVSQFYADVMQKNMRIPDEKLNVVHIGIELEKYKTFSPNTEIPTIGYLSRLNEENGFGLTIDAFIELKKKPEFKNAKLKATGGYTGDDIKYINRQKRKLKRNSILEDVEFIEDFKTESLDNFFDGLSILTVPVLNGEAFGLYQLESLASGIPLVQPELGAFEEISRVTGGGVVYKPNNKETLADTWAETLNNKEKLIEMSRNGQKSVKESFSVGALTEKMIEIYERVVKKKKIKRLESSKIKY